MADNNNSGVGIFLATIALATGVSVSGVFDKPEQIDQAASALSAPAGETAIDGANDEAQPPMQMAAIPPAGEAVEPSDSAAPAAEAVEEPSAGESAVEMAALPPAVPGFDILRVEPDGSTLIAGTATPSAVVDIVRGSQVVASTTAGPTGDFVALLDKALESGDHALVIRSTGTDGSVVTSTQTAIVAVPDDPAQGILALVEEPGAPSRLIAKPQVAALEPVIEDPVAEETMTAMAEPELEAASEPEQIAPAQVSPGVVIPDLPLLSAQAPTVPAAPAPTPDTIEEAPAEIAAIAEPVEPVAPAPVNSPMSPAQVSIDAVEIDGATVFVAGAAEPGARVRVYANDILLGDAQASPSGRFLVQTNRNLPVGDYIVRADVIDPLTADVLARVAVPFERPQGARIAAVAPSNEGQEPQTPSAQVAQTGQIEIPQAIGALDGQGSAIAGTPLIPTDESVIIRRGDTLWQISRRVYGRGVKYTTIYLANEDQIKDPGRIWPGQIFSVPIIAREDAEDVHRQLRGN